MLKYADEMFCYNTQIFLVISPSLSLQPNNTCADEGSICYNKTHNNTFVHQMWTYKLNVKSAKMLRSVGWEIQLINVSRERSASDCLTLKKTAQKSFEALSVIYQKTQRYMQQDRYISIQLCDLHVLYWAYKYLCFKPSKNGAMLELSNGVVYIKFTPMQILISEIIILYLFHKENKVRR